jgi:hypothetical protein
MWLALGCLLANSKKEELMNEQNAPLARLPAEDVISAPSNSVPFPTYFKSNEKVQRCLFFLLEKKSWSQMY